jgi:hypothetical protein
MDKGNNQIIKTMELITLATTALTLASPYLVKSGEKIAENIGEGIWNFIKKPFTSENDKKLISDLSINDNIEIIKAELINKLSKDPVFEAELRKAVENAQSQLINNAQQNINNSGEIEKQINIQQNSGNIQM